MRLCVVFCVVLSLFGCNGYHSPTHRSLRDSSSKEYLTMPTNRITIPIMVHFDKALTDRLAQEYKIKTRRKLKDISRKIFKEAEAFYRHPSLNQSIHFFILDTKFMRPSKLEMEDNASVYLKNYCTKQGVKKKESKMWWYSVLLTGRDLFHLNGNGEEVRGSTGRGYVGGICAITKSCTVVEWNSRNIGYLLAHEIGHSLGMTHDGAPYNECRQHVNIMGSKYHPRYHPKSWSVCSKRHLQKFMQSYKARCLRKQLNWQIISAGR